MSHPLDGIWEKTRRADEHIKNLNDEITIFLNSNVYSVVSEPNEDAREHILRIVGPEPPLRFSVIAGEIIHQCRSALDHLVGQLVIANKGKPDHRHEFPICENANIFKEARQRGKIKGISTAAANIIESIQPYHNPKGFEWHPLWVLHSMDVTDKHRLLMVIVADAGISTIRLGGEGEGAIELIGLSEPKWPTRPTQNGTEILRVRFGKPEPKMKVESEPIVQIAFEKYGPIAKQPVIHCVSELKSKTIGTILRFVQELRHKDTHLETGIPALYPVKGQFPDKLT